MKTQNNSLNATQWQARAEKLQKELVRIDEYQGKFLTVLDGVMRALVSASRVADPALQPALSKLLAALKEAKPLTQITTQSEALTRRIDDSLRADSHKNQQAAKTLVDLLERLQDAVAPDQAGAVKSLKRDVERARKKHEQNFYQFQHDFLQRYAAVVIADESCEAVSSTSRLRVILQKLFGLQGSLQQGDTDEGSSPTDTQVSRVKADEANSTSDSAKLEAPPSGGNDDANSAADSQALTGFAGREANDRPVGGSTLDFSLAEPKHSAQEVSYGEVASILLGLLADIDAPDAAKALVKDLYGRLEKGVTESSLVSVLDDAADVVSQTLRRDQSDFVTFLDELDSRLQLFNQFVVDLVGELGDSAQLGERLEMEVCEYLDQIQIGAEKADSLDQLKAQIGESVDQASNLLSAFVAGQKENFSALKSRANQLQQQVEVLQQESERNKQALAQQREKLFRDKLTQIPNREAYESRIADEFTRWQRYRRPLSYAIADIDFFKSINDNYGHAAGDKVLTLVAKIIRQSLRESDFVARYGGEEFVIILPETILDNARISLEKVREAIVTSPFNFNKQPVPVTCSFGVTEFVDGDELASVFERADAALYRAKESGRNQVVSS